MFKTLLPRIYAKSIYDINLQELKKHGITAFIFDIDNTLAPYATTDADDNLKRWIALVKSLGFECCIVSNNDANRVERFCASLEVPYIAKAGKPLSRGLLAACALMKSEPASAALVGDQLFTDIYGGNRLGMLTVLVKPISDVEGKFIKFKRFFERIILKCNDR